MAGLTKKDSLLELLSDKQWHSNSEMLEYAGYRYSSRKAELVNEGWIIEKRHAKGGKWEYRLKGRRYE